MTTRSWFGPYVRPQARISVDAIHDLMHRELADCGVRLDFPVLPQHPFVIPETSYRELFRAGHGLLRLLRRAVLRSGTTRRSRMAALGAGDSAYPIFADDDFEERFCALMARPDVVIGPDGPKFVEFNVSGTFGGPTESQVFTSVWHQVYGPREEAGFWGFDSFRARADALLAARRELGAEPTLAVVGSRRDIPGAGSDRYFDLEVRYLRRRGLTADFFEPEDLLDGLGLPGRLRYALGLRYFNVVDWQNHGIDLAPVRTAVRAGWRLLPSQTSGMLANKKVLAWVSEGRPWMTETERDLADRYLPWTREVRDTKTTWRGRVRALPELLLAHPENFVLKKSIGMMGLEVLLGPDTGERRWADAVEDALASGDWIVQEYITPVRVPMVLSDGSEAGTRTEMVAPVLSPCLFGTGSGGCLTRFFPDGSRGVVSVYGFGAMENVAVAGTGR
ncbi:hypothetical protein ACRYCC_04250 [Actinomadura scrupuli]|uniref:hypothetical protein n=1 Tax=Actinomadura scrupuli TaxID=559629 RepID=UPI003D98C0F6